MPGCSCVTDCSGTKDKRVLIQGGGGSLLARLLPGLPALPQDHPQYDDVTGHGCPFRQPRALPQVGNKFTLRLQEMILKYGKASVFRIRMQSFANSVRNQIKIQIQVLKQKLNKFQFTVKTKIHMFFLQKKLLQK
jgi:hypothetical protein